MPRFPTRTAASVAFAFLLCHVALAQQTTTIKLPKNNFTPQQDVQYGLKAADEIRKQYPIITDEAITGYLKLLGDRLVNAAPPELNRPEYKYSFTPVNVKEINAFALPGGPMFVNRGMFDAAANEGEVVGVMAHELSHVLLRHGTANATKAQNPWLQLGQVAGAVGGSMVGGAAGSMIAQGTEFGLGTLMLRYSRDYEKQADLLGVRIMAQAGYDPRDLAHMFETIENKSAGSGNPQWLSSHPNPGNRTAYINQAAATLTVAPAPDMSQFESIKSHFAAQPAPKSMAEVERRTPAAENTMGAVGTPGRPVPAPSAQFKEFAGGKVFQASVPDNWTQLTSKTAIRVVPENGYGESNGQTMFTHGVEFGVTQAGSSDLVEATRTFLGSMARNNQDLKLSGQQQTTRISARPALVVPLMNPSPLGGQEKITMTTVLLSEGTLFYYLTIVPEKDAAVFEPVFRKIFQSIKLN